MVVVNNNQKGRRPYEILYSTTSILLRYRFTCKVYVYLHNEPGLSLVILYEVHDIKRFPRVQDFISYSRLVKCAKQSGGKRLGTSGSKIGNVHLKWAFSEAAVLFIRADKRRQKYYEKLKQKHGKGKALSVLAAKLGRALYHMLKKEKVFDEEKFLRN